MQRGAPVAVLFTDIEGSTARWESEPAAMGQALADHDRILHHAFAEAGGEVVKSTGDGALVVFEAPGSAVAAAREAQARLDAHRWPTSSPLRVRMGVHVGTVERRDGDVFGPTVNLAARVADAGNGGQIVLSEPTRALVGGVEAVECGAFRLSGVADPQPLHLVVDGHGAEATPLRALPADRTNLPADLDEFVGRRDEQAALAGLVAEARLTTVCGPGGAGKTRLATRVAGHLAGRFPDGVWFVDLVGVGNRTELVQALASAVGARTTAGRPFEDQVLDHLRDQRSILVLDGCEHRYEETAELVEQLLGECPRLQLLATSREVLDVPGERVLRVGGLPVEPDGAAPGNADGAGEGATDLFLARARAAQPDLALDDDGRAIAARVCAAVDGLPLGIELAAAQLRSLSLAELPGHLAEVGARLGSSRRRRRGSRHASLAAVVSASWALVDAEDRPVLDRIGVFAGAFSAESAAEVCGLARADCVDVLGALVDKSLLVRVDREGQSRFRMLDTIRQWARDRLADQGDWDRARADHLRWALARIDDLERAMRTERQDTAIAAVAAVHDDLRAARAFALEQGDAHAALRISTSAPIDPEAERDAVLRDLLDRAGAVEPELRARTLYTSASAAMERGDWTNLARFASEAAALFGEVDDEAQAAYARMMYAFGRWGAGEEVGEELRELLDGFVATGDRFGEAYLRWAYSQWLVERFEASLTLFDDAVAAVGLFEEAGSAFGRAHAAEGVAYVAVALGRLDEASAWAIDALDAFVESAHPGCAAHALDAVAVAATRRGEPTAAAELVGAADALRARVGSALRPWELEHRARCTRELAESLSADGLQSALERGRALDLDAAVARARTLAERR